MILIVGGHPDYQDNPPEHDARWVMNKSFDRDADLVFEMHRREKWCDRIEHLNGFDCPVIMQERFHEINTAEPYPLTEVAAMTGVNMSCSIAYMMAMAMLQADDMAVWGVPGNSEAYEYQVPTIAYLAGLARARGLKVTFHPDSHLQRVIHPPKRYGYDGSAELFQ